VSYVAGEMGGGRSSAREGWRKTSYRRGATCSIAVTGRYRRADVAALAFAILRPREQTRGSHVEGSRNVFEAACRRACAG